MTWVKCSERQPEDGEDCWVHFKSGLVTIRTHWYEDEENSNWESENESEPYHEAAHWMPYSLPEPPKTKVCRTCKEEKLVEAFCKNWSYQTLRPDCRKCNYEAQKLSKLKKKMRDRREEAAYIQPQPDYQLDCNT